METDRPAKTVIIGNPGPIRWVIEYCRQHEERIAMEIQDTTTVDWEAADLPTTPERERPQPERNSRAQRRAQAHAMKQANPKRWGKKRIRALAGRP